MPATRTYEPTIMPPLIARSPRRPNDRRRLAAAFLSSVYPGLGQLVNGHVRLALTFAVPIALLVGALLFAYLLPADALLAIGPTPVRYTVASVVAFLHVFLANVVFASSFKLTGPEADVAFASNLLGIMAGGMLEYSALVIGYRHLLVLVIAFYVASALLLGGRRGLPLASEEGRGVLEPT